jgi:hypothetical protein
MDAIFVGADDLMARTRVEQAAAAAGVELRRVRPTSLVEELRAKPVDLVVIDLDAGRAAVVAEVAAARDEGLLPARTVGFFSHVDADLGRAARAAGCEALPRGRFFATLAEVFASRAG